MIAAAAVDVLVYLSAKSLGFSSMASFLAAVCFGAGTFVWFYSRTFLAETTSMLASFGAFYALLTLKNRLRIGPIVAFALLMTLALLLRIGNVALLAPMAVWLLGKLVLESDLSVKRFVTYLATWSSIVLIGLLAIAFYNLARCGNVFETGYRAEANAFTTPLWVGLYGLVLSPGKGLFEYAPILVVGCIGWLALLRQQRSAAVVIAMVVLANVVLYARWYEWWGGGVWGPRFVLPALPFIALRIPAVIDKARGVVQRGLIGALAFVSIGIQVLSVVVPTGTYFQIMFASPALFDRYLWSPAESPIVAAVQTVASGNFAPDLAPVYYDSASLAVLQVAALVVAVVLLVSIARALVHGAAATGAMASPAPSAEMAEPDEPGSRARTRSPA